MIVECSECSTQFQLDESRVPAKGIKVRCSRCKHAFFLRPPGASQSQAIDEVASEAARAGGVPPPEATRDLPSERQVEAGGKGNAEEEEESDWEFNEEIPTGPSGDLTGGEDLREDSPFTRSPRDLSDAGADGQQPDVDGAGSGIERPAPDDAMAQDESQALGAEDADDPPADSEIPGLAHGNIQPEAEAREDGQFGSAVDFSSLGEEEQAGEASLSSDAPEADDQLRSPEPRPAAGEDLGDPENWDFFSDQSLDSAPPYDRAGPFAKTAAGASSASSALSQRVAAEIDAFDSDLDAYPGEFTSPSVSDSWVGRAGRAAGWILVVALFGAGLVRGLFPDFVTAIASPSVAELGDLSIGDLRGSWLDTARAGTLFAVTGHIQNRSLVAEAQVGALQVALLDARGSRLDLEPAPLTAPLDQASLRELSIEALRQSRRQAARELAATVLPPGKAVSFEAVFASVPAAARRYQLEPASESEAAAMAEREALERDPEARTEPIGAGSGDVEPRASEARAVEMGEEGIAPAATAGSSPR